MDLTGAELIGIISLVISLITLAALVWGFGYRWGIIVGRITALEDKVGSIYRIFVENALTYQTQMGNISHSSPYKLTNKGNRYPLLLSQAQMLSLKQQQLENAEILLRLISTIGMDTLVDYCFRNNMTVSQAVAQTIVAVHSCEDGNNNP